MKYRSPLRSPRTLIVTCLGALVLAAAFPPAHGEEAAPGLAMMRRQRGGRLRRLLRPSGGGTKETVPLTEIKSPRGPDAPALGPGDYSRTLDVDGRTREYHLHVPRGYDGSRPVPLVLNFHGGAGNAQQQRRDTQMDAVADTHGFIVAYGVGTSAFGKFLTWNIYLSDTYATKKNVDDIGYVKAMLDDIEALFKIDTRRVYATGYSMGGILSYRLACEMSDRIAAIAPVAATMQNPPETRTPKRPVPVMHFHGMQDDHCLYEGGVGENARDKMDRPAATDGIQWWIGNNKVGPEPARTGAVGQAKYIQYGADGAAGEVVVWEVGDGGHTWPGGQSTLPPDRVGPVSTSINASEAMWDFFSRHAL
jgi:polyhydroxybutyrate depolymerase